MKILLISPPVYIPTAMPYALAMLKAVLSSSLREEIKVLDLNAQYHYHEFNEFYQQKGDYFTILKKFINKTRQTYPQISKDAIAGRKPPGFEWVMNSILSEKPDIVGISLSYNSQVFFAKFIIDCLHQQGIRVILGGPADYAKIMENALVLSDAEQLVDTLIKLGARSKKQKNSEVVDFTDFQKEHYLTKELIYPLKTSSSCPYQKCTFCTHHAYAKYTTLDFSLIKKAIIKNKMKKVFFIDDNFTISHIQELAKFLAPLNVEWWCQLRPTRDFVKILPQLYSSGLRCITWGVESGSQRMLNLMEKGTNLKYIEQVLQASKAAGIKNIVYVMFGFPTETEREFLQTIEFLEKNSSVINLVSASVFGLQQGSRIYQEPQKFGVKQVILQPRTFLSDKIDYLPASGLTNEEAKQLKKKYRDRINKINKVPKIIAACKEQILNV